MECWLCAGNDMAQLVCSRPSCRVLLLYPRGATQVQCSMCSMINRALAVRPLLTSAFLQQMTDPDVQHFSSVFPKMPCLSGGGLTQILCVMSCHDLGQLLSYHAPDFAHHDIFPYTCSFLLQANQIGHLICACCHMTLMFAHGAQSVKCAVCNHVTPVNMSSVIQPQQQQR